MYADHGRFDLRHLPMAVRGELGQLPLHLWWKERLLKYFDKLCSEDIPLLLKDAVNLSMHYLSSGSYTNWGGKIRSLNQTGFSSCFSPSHGCDSTLRNQIMCTLRDQFIQKWAEDLLREQSVRGQGGNSKLRTIDYLINKWYQSLELQWQYYIRVVIHWFHKPRSLPVSDRLYMSCCRRRVPFFVPMFSHQTTNGIYSAKTFFSILYTSCLWSRILTQPLSPCSEPLSDSVVAFIHHAFNIHCR